MERSPGNPDLLGIWLSQLNQTEGCFKQLAACNFADFSSPAPSTKKVNHGLNNGIARLRCSQLENGYKSCRPEQAAATTAFDMSGLPPAVPFAKPKPLQSPSLPRNSAASLSCWRLMNRRTRTLPLLQSTEQPATPGVSRSRQHPSSSLRQGQLSVQDKPETFIGKVRRSQLQEQQQAQILYLIVFRY